jgi:predicted alpha/beta hydrolase family esterase
LVVNFISGLGADERIFKKIVLPDNVIINHIHWIEPLPQEAIQEYCKRLLPQIDVNNKFILIGLSFGGMVAIELSKIIHPRQVIIISSVATAKEFPLQFKIVKHLRLHKIIPIRLIKIPNPIVNWFFGVKTKKEKEMLQAFSKNVSPNYLKWSMNTVLNWNNKQKPDNLVHIHGKNDKIFPSSKTNADITIEKGGHLMVYNQAKKISDILSDIINKQNK